MSDTPETDAELAELGLGYYTMGGLPANAVCVEFCRKLERERDEARSDLAYRLEQYAIKQLQLSDARKTILELQKK